MLKNKKFNKIKEKVISLMKIHHYPHDHKTIEKQLSLLALLAHQVKLSPDQQINKEKGKELLYQYETNEQVEKLFYTVFSEFITHRDTIYFISYEELNILAALYYHNNPKKINELIGYSGNSLWRELIEAYILLGDSAVLFQHVIDNLEQDKHWQQLIFWENMLRNIPDDALRFNTTGQFAIALLTLLSRCKKSDENDSFVILTYASYVLYQSPYQLEEYHYQIYKSAEHPFVKSIAFSILFNNEKYGEKVIGSTLEQLRLDSKTAYSEEAFYDFLLNYHNTAYLLLFMHDDVNLLYELLEIAASASAHAQLWILYDIVKFLDSRQYAFSFNMNKIKSIINFICIDDLRFFYQKYELDHLRENFLFNEFKNLKHFAIQFQYYRLNKIEKHQDTIIKWLADLKKSLNALSDEALLELFPHAEEGVSVE